ncbi:MAG: response regulator [Sedimenticola sp.]
MIDDTLASLKLLADLLISQGYQVRPTDDPKLGLESAIDTPPSLILLDVKMPGMDGFEVCRRLKKDARTAEIPVVFISASVEVDDQVHGFKVGGVDFITKPFQQEEVLARVGTHLELSLKNRQLAEAQELLEQKVRERTADLAQSEAQFRRLVEKSPDLLYRFSSQRGGTYYSPRVEDVLGYTPQYLLEHPMLWQESIHPDDLGRVSEAVEGLFTDEGFDIEYRIRDAQGRWRWLRDRNIDIIRDGDEAIVEGLASDITERKEAEQELELSRERLRSLSNHLQQVREDEKKHIAREIHDELGGMLTAIKLDADWLQEQLDDKYYDAAAKIADMTELVLDSIRRIVTELRPTLLDDMGLWAALEWQLGEFDKRTGIQCILKTECDDSDASIGCDKTTFSPKVSIVLFRVVQEALTNIYRHASATRVDIACALVDEKVNLSIRDNGIGFDDALIDKPSSHGIRGMYERAGSMGGSLQIESQSGSGTLIRISLPLEGQQDDE